MILGMYAIYDKMVGYMIPSFCQNDQLAIRNFEIDITAPEARAINVHPEDFNLQKIGTYDTETGVLLPTTPTILVDAGSFVRKEI